MFAITYYIKKRQKEKKEKEKKVKCTQCEMYVDQAYDNPSRNSKKKQCILYQYAPNPLSRSLSRLRSPQISKKEKLHSPAGLGLCMIRLYVVVVNIVLLLYV